MPTDTAQHAEKPAEQRAAVVRTFWASVQGRDWALARSVLADDCVMFWRASGEYLLDADAIIRVNRIYPEGWSLRLLEATPMVDGRVHSAVEVQHGPQRFIAHTLWRFKGLLIAQADETWATAETPPAWRTAEAIGAYRRDPGSNADLVVDERPEIGDPQAA